MADDFSLRYGDLLTGSYDCVDRIVLNAFYPLRYQPGGLRVWWRRWHNDSDEELDNTTSDTAGRQVRAPGQGVGRGQRCTGDLLQGR